MYFLITRLPSQLDAAFFPSLSVVFFLQDHEASEDQVHAQPVLLHNALCSFVGRLAPHTRSANPHHVAHEAFRSMSRSSEGGNFLQISLNEQSSDASAQDCTSVALFQLLALPSCHSARGVHGSWRQIFSPTHVGICKVSSPGAAASHLKLSPSSICAGHTCPQHISRTTSIRDCSGGVGGYPAFSRSIKCGFPAIFVFH